MKGVYYNLKFKCGDLEEEYNFLNKNKVIEKMKQCLKETFDIDAKVNESTVYNLSTRPKFVNELVRNFFELEKCHLYKLKKNLINIKDDCDS